MSNQIIVPPTFSGPVAAVFQGQQAGDDLSGGITGGYGLIKYRGKVWSIQHNGNSMTLMRDDGDGARGSIDVVILKANALLSKTFYETGWDENNNNPPDCASANGIVPDQGVPKPQSAVCATCPRNAWGSAANGGKGKACGDHRRMAVVPLTDLRNETFGGPLLLRCPAASLQDLSAFDNRYKGMGYPYFTMGIKIGFDPVESYPKFTFNAIRPLSDVEGAVVMELRNSPETARVIHEGSAPAQVAIAAPAAAPAFLEPAPAVQMVQPAAAAPVQQVAPQPIVVAPVAQPAPIAAAPVAQPASQPAATSRPAPVPATGGGFGPTVVAPAPVAAPQPAAAVTPAAAAPVVTPSEPTATAAPIAQPAPQPAPQAAPTRQMTGFGAVAPDVTPGVTQAAPVQAPPATAPQPAPQPAPGVVSAFEGSIDERLNALLASS